MQGKTAIANILKQEGVEFVFAFPNNPLIDAVAAAGISRWIHSPISVPAAIVPILIPPAAVIAVFHVRPVGEVDSFAIVWIAPLDGVSFAIRMPGTASITS